MNNSHSMTLPNEGPMLSTKAVHSLIAGALFDFMGMLTTRNEVTTLSARHVVGPAVQAIEEFARKRGLSLDGPAVAGWHETIALDTTIPASRAVELAEPAEPIYLIFFDDQDRKPEVLAGGVAIARERFHQISNSWNAHLFVKIASNSRNSPYYSRNAIEQSQQVPVCTMPAKVEELLDRLIGSLELDGDGGITHDTSTEFDLRQALRTAERPYVSDAVQSGSRAPVPLMDEPPQAAQTTQTDIYFWLVELFEPNGNSMGYYHRGFRDFGGCGPSTKDPRQAKRYTTKEDAERVASKLMHLAGVWQAVEHGFASPAPAATVEQVEQLMDEAEWLAAILEAMANCAVATDDGTYRLTSTSFDVLRSAAKFIRATSLQPTAPPSRPM